MEEREEKEQEIYLEMEKNKIDKMMADEDKGKKEVDKILKFYTVITSTLDVFRGELSFPQDKPVEQWPEP